MNKLLLSLGLVATLAAPAFAQSAYDEPQTQTQQGGQQGGQTGIDYSLTTRSIPSAGSTNSNDAAGLRLSGTDKQRGAQGEFFGANGR